MAEHNVEPESFGIRRHSSVHRGDFATSAALPSPIYLRSVTGDAVTTKYRHGLGGMPLTRSLASNR